MDFILGNFESGKQECADHPQLSKMFNSGWSKLDKYYCLTEETPIYVAALVLNPRHKWAYINATGRIKKSEKIIKELWDAYKPQDTDMAPSQTVTQAETSNQFLLFLEEQDAEAEVIEDEYAHCCSQPTIKINDARNWWLQPTQQQLYPHLGKLALEILSIPTMSAEPERLLSVALLVLLQETSRLCS
jgi:hypothetical protein